MGHRGFVPAVLFLWGIRMKTLILGAGAMGCLFGAKLKQAGYDVTLFNRENTVIKQIESHGIELTSSDEKEYTIQIPVCYRESELKKEYELIIVLVKAFATEQVLSEIKHIIDENTIVLSLQNGVGNLEIIQEVIPQAIHGIGGTGSGASVLGPGQIAHRATGKTNIGLMNDITGKKAEAISKMLTNAGIETAVSSNVQSVIWSKLLINVAFNSLTAVTKLKNGDAILTKDGEKIATKLIEEAVNVAKAEKIELLYNHPVKEILAIGHKQIARNQSSMLTDILNERKTEIEVINGAIAVYGKRHGISTPYNEMMTELIHIIEKSYNIQVK